MCKIIQASVYLVVKNEESNIERALRSAQRFAEIVVLDSGSSDNTVELAGDFPRVNVHTQAWRGFSQQKSDAVSLCSHEWVIGLDADEELSQDYVDAVAKLVEENRADALRGRRTLLRFGRKPRCFAKDDVLIRCFRKSAGRYTKRRVHEAIEIDGIVQETDSTIYHHENLSFTERIEKSNRYSTLSAQDKHDKGQRASLPVVALIFQISFIQTWLLKGHILDGTNGLLTAINVACYKFMKYAKLWELNRGVKQ